MNRISVSKSDSVSQSESTSVGLDRRNRVQLFQSQTIDEQNSESSFRSQSDSLVQESVSVINLSPWYKHPFRKSIGLIDSNSVSNQQNLVQSFSAGESVQ